MAESLRLIVFMRSSMTFGDNSRWIISPIPIATIGWGRLVFLHSNRKLFSTMLKSPRVSCWFPNDCSSRPFRDGGQLEDGKGSRGVMNPGRQPPCRLWPEESVDHGSEAVGHRARSPRSQGSRHVEVILRLRCEEPDPLCYVLMNLANPQHQMSPGISQGSCG